MVAKINRGASLYGAVIYNQQKVNEDTARIIAGKRMITDSLYDPDRIVSQTMFAFESYLAANRNTEKPILHISLNHIVCGTDILTLNAASEYLPTFNLAITGQFPLASASLFLR